MRPSDVTMGDRATKLCSEFGVSLQELKFARVNSSASYEGREFLIVHGVTSDGRTLRMACRHDMPTHIVSFRPVTQ